MPVRPVVAEKKAKAKKPKVEVLGERAAYEYEDLLIHIREHIDKEYNGVAAFLEHKDFLDIGVFTGAKEDKSKMFTYLSLPPEGEKARVKSMPVLTALYEALLGIQLESRIVVVRTQLITANKPLTKSTYKYK